ncbi:hypothetical protein, partial [Clostridium aquiflavi]
MDLWLSLICKNCKRQRGSFQCYCIKDNRKIKTIYPDGGIERFYYDANGNVIRHISPEYYNK